MIFIGNIEIKEMILNDIQNFPSNIYEKYFITFTKPNNKVILDYSKIWDYDAIGHTFIFSKREDGEEKIYEYNLQSGNCKCIVSESDISRYLHILDKDGFKSVYYHFSKHQISGVYGDVLFIYDVIKTKHEGEDWGYIVVNREYMNPEERKVFLPDYETQMEND